MENLKLKQNKLSLLPLVLLSGLYTGLFFSSFFHFEELNDYLLIFVVLSFASITITSFLIFIKYSVMVIMSLKLSDYLIFADKEIRMPLRVVNRKVSYEEISCYGRSEESLFVVIKGKKYRVNKDTVNSLGLKGDDLFENIILRIKTNKSDVAEKDIKEDYLQTLAPMIVLFILSGLHIYLFEADWFILLSFSVFIWVVNGIYLIPYLIHLQNLKLNSK